MPRLPVDGNKVVEHRITLGQYEREQLDTISTGYAVGRVAEPLVALLSDVSALVALTGIFEALGLIDLAGLARKGYGAGQQVIDNIINDVYNSVDEALIEAQRIIDEGIEAGEGLIEESIEDIPGVRTARTIQQLSSGDKLWITLKMLGTLPLRGLA